MSYPGEPMRRPPSLDEVPLRLWHTWFIVTGWFMVLNWFPFAGNPVLGFALLAPIKPALFGTPWGALGIPVALLALHIGEVFGQRLRYRVVRIVFNVGFLFFLTGVVELLAFGHWTSLRDLLA